MPPCTRLACSENVARYPFNRVRILINFKPRYKKLTYQMNNKEQSFDNNDDNQLTRDIDMLEEQPQNPYKVPDHYFDCKTKGFATDETTYQHPTEPQNFD